MTSTPQPPFPPVLRPAPDRRRRAVLLALPLWLAAGSARTQGALALPASAQLQFSVTGEIRQMHYSASATLDWDNQGTHYEARQQIRILGFTARAQTSRGQITATGLRPERFDDKTRKLRSAQLDWQQHQVLFSPSGATASLPDGAQDRLSVFFQLGALLAAQPQMAAGSRITLETVGTNSIQPWTFTVIGRETLQLPAGSVPALKLQRQPRREGDPQATLWLGEQLHHLPVRILMHEDNGDRVDLRLNALPDI
ncbi:hypothetical protein GCM10022279_30800 [Comamonas faecalis]|uniref:DUF3108 domain-containing protein n=1 Tax=Comamonas faecalis TaxID=1387849 RepID=A0ABP7RZT9_9BURK